MNQSFTQRIPENSLDFVRLMLAVYVMFAHFIELADVPSLNAIPEVLRMQSRICILGFFIISGLFLCLSYLNSKNFATYFIKRIKRIYPAYVVMLLLVIITSFFITELDIWSYLTHSQFYKYIGANISLQNYLQPTLPGVFTHNPFSQAVNGALWTLKVDMAFYLFIPVFIWAIMRLNRKYLQNALLLICYITTYLYLYIIANADTIPAHFKPSLATQFPGVLNFFVVGLFFYLNFNWVLRRIHYLVFIGILLFSERFIFNTLFVAPIGFGLILFYIGFKLPGLRKITGHNDYSYSLYIYHYPIAQTIIHFDLVEENIYLSLLLYIVCTALVSYFSWQVIEKPFLKSRKERINPIIK